MNPATSLPSRRDFVKRLGTGLVVWVILGRTAGGQVSEAAHPVTVIPKSDGGFDAFLSVGEDGHVTCMTGKIEMGQGVVTSLPQMLAEELDVSIDDITMIKLMEKAMARRLLAESRGPGADPTCSASLIGGMENRPLKVGQATGCHARAGRVPAGGGEVRPKRRKGNRDKKA